MDRHQQDSVLEGITVSCTPQEQTFDSPPQTTAVCESLELQVGDCETMVESKTEESHFEKSGGGRFPNHGLAETVLFPCGLSYSPVWLWSCPQHHLPKNWAGVLPAHAPYNRPAELNPGHGPQSGWDPASAPVSCQSCLPKNRAGDMSGCAPETGLLTLVLLQILKWPYNLFPAVLSHGLAIFLPAQGPCGTHTLP